MNGSWYCHLEETKYGRKLGRNDNTNPIIDTQQYEVSFYKEEVTELTSNVRAEEIYDHCDWNANEHVLLDYFVDLEKLRKGLFTEI